MKNFLLSVVLAGLLVGCGSDNDEEKNSPSPNPTATQTSSPNTRDTDIQDPSPTPTHTTQTNDSSGGTSKYLKFDEEFMSERETVDERYFVVKCEDVGFTYNDKDYGDIASYDSNGVDYVSKSNTGNKPYTLNNGELTFHFSDDVNLNLAIDKDYGDYVVVKINFLHSTTYTYWYPKPINSDVHGAFFGQGGTYMDHKSYHFNHQGGCTPNSLNEHIADWKSLQ
jgi:hypothetical protein